MLAMVQKVAGRGGGTSQDRLDIYPGHRGGSSGRAFEYTAGHWDTIGKRNISRKRAVVQDELNSSATPLLRNDCNNVTGRRGTLEWRDLMSRGRGKRRSYRSWEDGKESVSVTRRVATARSPPRPVYSVGGRP